MTVARGEAYRGGMRGGSSNVTGAKKQQHQQRMA